MFFKKQTNVDCYFHKANQSYLTHKRKDMIINKNKYTVTYLTGIVEYLYEITSKN